MLIIFITIILTLTIAVLFDLLVARFTGKRILGYVASFLITLIGFPLIIILVTPAANDVFEIIIALGIALMWWFIYLNAVQAVESSLRIRMLMEIQARGGALSVDELHAAYSDERLIRIRLKRLEEAGAVTTVGGLRRLQSKKLLNAALFFTALKRIILNKTSQFDGVGN